MMPLRPANVVVAEVIVEACCLKIQPHLPKLLAPILTKIWAKDEIFILGANTIASFLQVEESSLRQFIVTNLIDGQQYTCLKELPKSELFCSLAVLPAIVHSKLLTCKNRYMVHHIFSMAQASTAESVLTSFPEESRVDTPVPECLPDARERERALVIFRQHLVFFVTYLWTTRTGHMVVRFGQCNNFAACVTKLDKEYRRGHRVCFVVDLDYLSKEEQERCYMEVLRLLQSLRYKMSDDESTTTLLYTVPTCRQLWVEILQVVKHTIRRARRRMKFAAFNALSEIIKHIPDPADGDMTGEVLE